MYGYKKEGGRRLLNQPLSQVIASRIVILTAIKLLVDGEEGSLFDHFVNPVRRVVTLYPNSCPLEIAFNFNFAFNI